MAEEKARLFTPVVVDVTGGCDFCNGTDVVAKPYRSKSGNRIWACDTCRRRIDPEE